MRNLIYKFILIFTLVLAPHCRINAQVNDAVFSQQCENAAKLTLAQRYDEAIPLYEGIIKTLRSQNCTPDLPAVWLKGLGTCKLYTGRTGEAEKIYLEALNILNIPEYTNHKLVRQLYDAIAVLYIQTHNYEKADEYNDRAKVAYEKNVDYGDDYVRCMANAALIKSSMGLNTHAKLLIDVAMRQAQTNYNKSGNLNADTFISFRVLPYITILNNASQIYQNLGYYSDAVKVLKKSIEIAEEYNLKEPLPYNNLGILYLAKSRFTKASEWLRKSYELCRVPYETDEVGVNTALGLFLSKDAFAPEFCAEFSDRMRKNIEDMFAFMSGAERAIYWKHYENYLPMVNLIIHESGDTDYYGTIYDNILESKGLLLRSTNAIRDAILNSGNASDIADYTQIGKLKQQLLNEKDEVTRLAIEKEIEAIDKRLTQHVNAYADFAVSKNIRWEDVRNALAKDDAAIEFYNIPLIWGLDSIQTMDGEPRYCAVILRNGYNNPHIIPLCKESQLEELDREDLYETDSIYNLIWHPLEEELRGVKNIYFAADRELHKIGIEYAPVSENANFGNRYNLYRLSSTRVLVENEAKSKKGSAVLYGGLKYDLGKDELIAESRAGDYHPTYSSPRAFSAENSRYGVKYLPGTLKEVEEISQNFNSTPRLITDISGTEESFKSLAGSSTDIIHLATHGFFWTDEDAKKRDYVTFLNPNNKTLLSNEDKALMRSGLFFSGANIGLKGESLPDDVEDGVLTALELSNMNLGHVDMVVMSACESGLGETSGEGVFGLQRGFKLAGANTLLMSLWKVDDIATQLLMTDFYRNYLSGKSKLESLKLAQRSLHNNSEYSDPKYWAAFILLDGLN